MIQYADVVCGLAWGDEAKGKITSQLASSKDYNYVCRWAGGSNAGHTVYLKGNKYKTHLIPSGVFYGIPSIIGPGCVINKDKFLSELLYLQENGFDISTIKVSPRAHVVTDKHLIKDKRKLHQALGTTANGIAPCYADKAARTGILAKEILSEKLLWDEKISGKVLCEGAQGIWLDLDWGEYPYVTSSNTLPYGACSLGIPPQKIRNIYGAAKIYDTRSGVDPKFPDNLLENQELLKIADQGNEFGVTTGRRRKVNWLNLTMLLRAINLTGTTHLIISKVDILDSVSSYKVYVGDYLRVFENINSMKNFILDKVYANCPLISEIKFSDSPERI